MLFEVKISDETQRNISTLSKVAGRLGHSSWPVLAAAVCACPLLEGQPGEVRMWPLKARPHLASGGRCRPIWRFTCARGGGNPVEVCLFNSDLSPLSSLHQILSCGQPAATGSAWMDSLRRPHRPREPGHRPIPTLGTAPSLLPRAQNQAARRVGLTSQAWPGR